MNTIDEFTIDLRFNNLIRCWKSWHCRNLTKSKNEIYRSEWKCRNLTNLLWLLIDDGWQFSLRLANILVIGGELEETLLVWIGIGLYKSSWWPLEWMISALFDKESLLFEIFCSVRKISVDIDEFWLFTISPWSFFFNLINNCRLESTSSVEEILKGNNDEIIRSANVSKQIKEEKRQPSSIERCLILGNCVRWQEKRKKRKGAKRMKFFAKEETVQQDGYVYLFNKMQGWEEHDEEEEEENVDKVGRKKMGIT